MQPYPENCLRGIRKQDWIFPSGKVSALTFEPDKRTLNGRTDGLIETSISWEDNDQVLEFCFENCKDNFGFGAVRLSVKHIETLISNNDIGKFSYERNTKNTHKYHGNLLFAADIQIKERRLLENSLSFFASKVIPVTNTKQ